MNEYTEITTSQLYEYARAWITCKQSPDMLDHWTPNGRKAFITISGLRYDARFTGYDFGRYVEVRLMTAHVAVTLCHENQYGHSLTVHAPSHNSKDYWLNILPGSSVVGGELVYRGQRVPNLGDGLYFTDPDSLDAVIPWDVDLMGLQVVGGSHE
jgi:hypothetical protein